MVKYSFVVPIYNDAYLAKEFCQEHLAVFQQLLGTPDPSDHVGLIFVNDGSRDEIATDDSGATHTSNLAAITVVPLGGRINVGLVANGVQLSLPLRSGPDIPRAASTMATERASARAMAADGPMAQLEWPDWLEVRFN